MKKICVFDIRKNSNRKGIGRYMKRLKIVLCMAMCAVTLFGCKKTETGVPGENVPQSDSQDASEEVQTATDDRETEDGKVRSYLTGEWVDEPIGRRRPIAFMFNNLEPANPMSGISRAGVVYEAVVEGGLTRLMGVMENYDDLDKIGSVRSCRNYFVYYALELDAIYVHYGQAAYAKDLLNEDYVHNLSGLSGIGNTVFYRTADRKAPHNAYASAEGMKEGIEKMGYRNSYRSDFDGKFTFAVDGKSVDLTHGKQAKKVSPGYLVNKPYFEYHPEDGLYYRYQYGGPQIDELDGEQLAYKNIILQYSEWMRLDENDYLAFDCHSGGLIKYITDGKVVDGTWMRFDGDVGTTKFFDPTGKELVVNPGKTWICIIQDTKSDAVVIE